MNKYKYDNIDVDTFVCPIAWKLAFLFHWIKLTPNIVTTISLLFAIFGGILFSFQYYFASACLVGVYYFLDCVDGSIARRYNQKSNFGEAYDFCKDSFLFFCFIVMMIYYYGAITIIPLIIFSIHLLTWQSTMESKQDENHFQEKKQRLNNKVYLFLVKLYSKFGKVENFNFMGTGDFILVLMLTMYFNNFLLLFVYSLFIFLRYIIYVYKKHRSMHSY